MSNHLDNGTVLPHGLLGINAEAGMSAFNKSYKNSPLRMGVVVASYAYNDPKNYTKLTTEYDVIVQEQNENVSCTPIRYRNCVSAEGMGSIADFFEKNLRSQTQNSDFQEDNTSGQNGAIVILLCLDAFTQKAVIIGGLTQPGRQTDLTSTAPMLSGEYNGVAIKVNTDGSTSLTFQGATDTNGNVLNSSQGNTVVQISTDGSFSVQHSTITFQMERSGVVNIIAKGNVNVTTQAEANITTQGDTNIVTQANANITATQKIVEKAKEIDLNGDGTDQGRGVTSANSHQGVIDLITGVPVEPSQTVFIDV